MQYWLHMVALTCLRRFACDGGLEHGYLSSCIYLGLHLLCMVHGSIASILQRPGQDLHSFGPILLQVWNTVMEELCFEDGFRYLATYAKTLDRISVAVLV